MLVELGLVEQRQKAVLEVFDGSSVVDARQCGPPLWGVTPERARLVAPLRQSGSGRPG